MTALGIYIHFPWCIRHCPYCDFTVAVTRRPIPQARYADAVIGELRYRLAHKFRGRAAAQSVYFGGGTPGLWDAQYIGAVLAAVSKSPGLEANAEITVECNPEDLSAERVRALAAVGVNRLSLGVQSFDDRVLSSLGRAHRADDVARCLEAIAATSISRFSVDLIHGVAGQSIEAAVADAEQALRLGAPHVSTYQLTVEPQTVFGARQRRGESLLVSEVRLGTMYEAIADTLAAGGCPHYEISNAARPGHEAVHNSSYWQQAECLALGAGAHGCWREGGQVERWSNIRHALKYIRQVEAGGAPEAFREVVDAQAQRLERVMTGLRTREGLAPDAELLASFGRNAEHLRERCLLEEDPFRWRATREGRRLLDTVIGLLVRD